MKQKEAYFHPLSEKCRLSEFGATVVLPLPDLLLGLPHRASTAISSTRKLQRHWDRAEGQSRVGNFLRLGNDLIQPLEKSASNSLICKKLNFRACGLQNFDATRGERRRGRREWNGALTGRLTRVTKSAGPRRTPRKHAGPRNEKGQPRMVGLVELVVGWNRTAVRKCLVWPNLLSVLKIP
jgi:hypothetical protein